MRRWIENHPTEIIIVSWCLIVLGLAIWLLPYAHVKG
jgi:hypothetical protein